MQNNAFLSERSPSYAYPSWIKGPITKGRRNGAYVYREIGKEGSKEPKEKTLSQQ